jgi:hypothetical protein
MKNILAIAVVLISRCLVMFVGATILHASTPDLPGFAREDLSIESRVTEFLSAFIERDKQAGQILNASNRMLFAQGYRPKTGVPNDPEAGGQRFVDIKSYFTKKLYLDLKSIQPPDKPTFQSFIDQIGRWGDQTLLCAGKISEKYDLNIEGRFIFETELVKIPAGSERETFKNCWLNDSFLGTEMRMLAWIYRQLFNTPYINPEKR